jgi:hypothetical protein
VNVVPARVYFAAEFEKVVYILDAGIKKSPHGKEFPAGRSSDSKSAWSAQDSITSCTLDARYEARKKVRNAKLTSDGVTPGNGF